MTIDLAVPYRELLFFFLLLWLRHTQSGGQTDKVGSSLRKTKLLSWFLGRLCCRSPGRQRAHSPRPSLSWPAQFGRHSDFALFSINGGRVEGGIGGMGKGGAPRRLLKIHNYRFVSIFHAAVPLESANMLHVSDPPRGAKKR